MAKEEGRYRKITTDDTLMETKTHGDDSFSFSYYEEDFWDFDFHCVDWHWHDEVEFLLVRDGCVRGLVERDEVELPAGTGLFVNSRTLHRFETDGPTNVPNVVFSPSLIAPPESRIDRQYIRPVLASPRRFLVLQREPGWQGQILQKLDCLFRDQETVEPDLLQDLSLLSQIWDLVFQNLAPLGGTEPQPLDTRSARLQQMMQYIHDHYFEPITLTDIAAAAFIGKNTAIQTFQDSIQVSPVSYLIQYRLKKAANLLCTTEKRIGDIAEATGFNSAGYFCRKFRYLYGQTPEGYRNSKRNAERV